LDLCNEDSSSDPQGELIALLDPLAAQVFPLLGVLCVCEVAVVVASSAYPPVRTSSIRMARADGRGCRVCIGGGA